ncbi:hypothetical protein ABZZ79_27180 [Streptomyces sp. NPDC006458]|uniref:hypothetical protein n=1 Tax=Streptomyces sp. NPDC006458 TaxID=3154302 RepID=UPI00339F2F77
MTGAWPRRCGALATVPARDRTVRPLPRRRPPAEGEKADLGAWLPGPGFDKNTTRGIVALVFRCKPSGGTERTSNESTAVSWLIPAEVSERMSEVFAVRLLDALDGNGPQVRSHDGKRLIPAG